MATAALVATLGVAVLHLLFLAMETVGWSKMARGFGYKRDEVELTRTLAANQGFYNGGVACLLVWAALTGQAATVTALMLFVIAMAIVGAITAKWTILVIQGAPAALALALHLLA